MNDFKLLKNYVTDINNFANADYIDKYLEYINQKKIYETNIN
jgi:hypothetical protein